MLVLCSCREGFGQLGDSALKALKKEEKKYGGKHSGPTPYTQAMGFSCRLEQPGLGNVMNINFICFFVSFGPHPPLPKNPNVASIINRRLATRQATENRHSPHQSFVYCLRVCVRSEANKFRVSNHITISCLS